MSGIGDSRTGSRAKTPRRQGSDRRRERPWSTLRRLCRDRASGSLRLRVFARFYVWDWRLPNRISRQDAKAPRNGQENREAMESALRKLGRDRASGSLRLCAFARFHVWDRRLPNRVSRQDAKAPRNGQENREAMERAAEAGSGSSFRAFASLRLRAIHVWDRRLPNRVSRQDAMTPRNGQENRQAMERAAEAESGSSFRLFASSRLRAILCLGLATPEPDLAPRRQGAKEWTGESGGHGERAAEAGSGSSFRLFASLRLRAIPCLGLATPEPDLAPGRQGAKKWTGESGGHGARCGGCVGIELQALCVFAPSRDSMSGIGDSRTGSRARTPGRQEMDRRIGRPWSALRRLCRDRASGSLPLRDSMSGIGDSRTGSRARTPRRQGSDRRRGRPRSTPKGWCNTGVGIQAILSPLPS